MSVRLSRCGLVVVLCVASLAFGQGDPQVIAKILDEGKNHNQIMLHMRHITKRIGARLLGSKRFQTACDWTLQEFKTFGLKNVHLEPWGQVPVEFDRGRRQCGRMISPTKRDFQFTTRAWAAGTHGAVRGPAVLEPTSQAEFDKVKSQLNGAWVVSVGPGLTIRSVPAPAAPDLRQAVSDCSIAGRVYGSADEFVHTGGSYRGLTWDKLPQEPQVIVRASDMKAIKDALLGENVVTLEFNIENRFVNGPITVGNVVADIPGTEKPDEYVIVSGHLDSWDGPGSEGASDNGTGSMATLEAARILAKSGAKPKRTIRFVLWTGEEEGLLGSAAYVRDHKAEWDKISVCFVDDGGSNYDSGITCPESQQPYFADAVATMNKAFPDMPQTLNTTRPGPSRGGGGSDHASFNAVGIPGVFLRKAGRQNYLVIWHTQNDRLDQVIPEYMRFNATELAVLGYDLGCADKLLPRR